MHPKNCCALLLLAFVACQAAPSPKIIDKKSISETESKFTKDGLTLEDAGADKDRAKKSATTFCVEVRSEKDEQEPKPLTILQPISAPAPAPTSLTIVQPAPAPVPAPAPLTIVQPAPVPAPAPTPLTIVQPAPAPIPEPISVNVIQPAPQTETFYYQPIQPAFQPQLASLVLPQQVPQPTPQIVVPAPAPAPAPTQYVNILPSPAAPCAPQPSSYIVQTQPAPKPVQTVQYYPPQPQPQPQTTYTVIQQEPIKLEQEKPKPQIKPIPMMQIVPESHHQDHVLQCNCRPENHLKVRHSNVPQRIMLPPSASLGPAMKNLMLTTQNEPNSISAGVSPVFAAREAEARHHHKQKLIFTPLQYSVYSSPSIIPAYYEYNSYPNAYPSAINYNSDRDYSYPYGGVPSVTVNAGGPFLGHTPRDAQANNELHSDASEVIDLSSNQKREADLTKLKDAEKNEIMQQQVEKNRVIKDASADTIKIGGTK